MAARHVTARGQPFDMARLRDLNAHKPALGNANLNARGDIIGPGGVILKTQEQIDAEWLANRRAAEESIKVVDIKSDMSELTKPAPVIKKQLLVDDQDFDPNTISIPTPVANHSKPVTKRKMSETD